MKKTIKLLSIAFLATVFASQIIAAETNAPTQSNGKAVLKKIVAVWGFENKSSYSGGGQDALDEGMADQLTDALVQSGNFIVVERQIIAALIKEQDAAIKSGRMQKSDSAQIGKLISAQILVKGTITEFAVKSSGSGNTINIPWIKLKNNRQEAHVGLTIRLVDTTTGEVLDSQRVEGTATSGGLSTDIDLGGVSFGNSSFKETPMGKATQMAIDDAVSKITAKLKNVSFQARVVKINGDNEMLISGGKRAGISEGDSFILWSVGEALVDPSTGEQLGCEMDKKGSVKVTKVEEKYAKAKSETPLTGIKVGDIVKTQ